MWLLTCTGGFRAKNCAGVSNLLNHSPNLKKWLILLNHPSPNAQRRFAPLLTSYDSFKTSDVQYDFTECFTSICYSQNPYLHLVKPKYASLSCTYFLYYDVTRKVCLSRWRLFPAMKLSFFGAIFVRSEQHVALLGTFKQKLLKLCLTPKHKNL